MDEVILRARCDLCGDTRTPAVLRAVVGVSTTTVAEAAEATPLPRPDLMVVDLCDTHMAEAAAVDLLAGHGRPLSRRHTAPAVYASGQRVGRPATSGGHPGHRRDVPTRCPVGGCASVVRRNNVSHHLVNRHDWRVPRQPKRCPDCGLRIEPGARQTMQAHRAAIHGYDYLAALIEANR